ncbi:MAG: hypothetical protein J6I53_11505 [Treponema sp.]|nr:hypothetical protein [Treponema sp.]
MVFADSLNNSLSKFFSKKIEYELNRSLGLGVIVKSKAIDFLMFIVLFGILYLVFELCPKTRSYNTFFLPLYIFLDMNLFGQTVGGKITKIKLVNETFYDKLKIFLNNFLIVSPVYILLVQKKFLIVEAKIKLIVEFLLLLNLINLFARLFIIRKKSLFEEILGINYVAIK